MDQKELRRIKIFERNKVPLGERSAWSNMICERIMLSPIFYNAKTVMLYQSIKGEVQLKSLERFSENSGKKFVYPLCTAPGEMIALYPKTNNAWKKGFCGIMEPVRACSDEVLQEDIDLVICPCTVFDSNCNRIGMGGGYYDRFLTRCKKAVKVAVAFEIQKADQIISQPWDIKMDMIFTERNTYLKSNGF